MLGIYFPPLSIGSSIRVAVWSVSPISGSIPLVVIAWLSLGDVLPSSPLPIDAPLLLVRHHAEVKMIWINIESFIVAYDWSLWIELHAIVVSWIVVIILAVTVHVECG